MIVRVVLFGVFREKLPPQARGRATLELPEGSPLRAVLEHFNLPPTAACAVNGQLEPDRERMLQEGDEVQIFRPAGGGSPCVQPSRVAITNPTLIKAPPT